MREVTKTDALSPARKAIMMNVNIESYKCAHSDKLKISYLYVYSPNEPQNFI